MGLYFANLPADIFAVLILIVCAAYVYMKLVVFQYWERRGIPSLKASFPLGNFGPAALQRLSVGEVLRNLYNQSTDRFIGVHVMARPILILRDPELIRRIFIKDFAHFHSRGIYVDEKVDPMSVSLPTVSGIKWKNMREQLTPAFTAARLKEMFSMILDSGVSLQNVMYKAGEKAEVIDVRELAACYTTDAIVSLAFGLESNSIENPDAEFRQFGRKHFKISFNYGLRTFVKLVIPTIQKYLKVPMMAEDFKEYIIAVVQQNLEYREKNNVTRKDIFQLMIQLRNSGKVQKDGDWDSKLQNDESQKTMSVIEIASHMWLFFVGGFETTAIGISFCLFEMAKNQRIQKKVQEEIDEVYARYNNQITYESLSEMRYLEACIDETLRKYPPIPIINRECNKDYQIPGTNTIIEKGTAIIVPLMGLHYDPQFYPNPNHFEPERFLATNASDKSFAEMPYLPFGDGPRMCIANRIATVEIKIAIILALQKTSVHLPDNAPRQLKLSPQAMATTPYDGVINLKVTTRN